MGNKTSYRTNEHGVEIMVCCDTDMELEVITGRRDILGGWGEFWCCKVCYMRVMHKTTAEQRFTELRRPQRF